MTAWMTFSVRGEPYALPLAELREVIRVERITPIPRAPAHARGLTSVRGRLVPVIDAAIALGGAPCPTGGAARILIVHHDHRPLGILVEEVAGLVVASDETAPPRRLALPQLEEAP
jgi:purine-binding chemotaxis protein CheW